MTRIHQTKVHWASEILVAKTGRVEEADDLRRATALWRAAYRYCLTSACAGVTLF